MSNINPLKNLSLHRTAKRQKLVAGATALLCICIAQPQSVLAQSLVDADSDGLIDISNLIELNAIRFALDGTGQRLSEDGQLDSSGCPLVDGKASCHGYELTNDINFDSNQDGQLNEADMYWNEGTGWVALGDPDFPFTGVFEGNGYLIQNLMIHRREILYQGLFGYALNANIRNVGIRGPLTSIKGYYFLGGLLGAAKGTEITGSYFIGPVSGEEDYIGGLIGEVTDSKVTACYSLGDVDAGGDYVGALIGRVFTSEISANYAVGTVTGREVMGELLGSSSDSTLIDNYWSYGETVGNGTLTSQQLKCPTKQNDTSCAPITLFNEWNTYLNSDNEPYWVFGTAEQLPTLRLNGIVHSDEDGDGIIDNNAPVSVSSGHFTLLWTWLFTGLLLGGRLLEARKKLILSI